MADKMFTTWDGMDVHAKLADRANADAEGNSLTLGLDASGKVATIGGKEIAGGGGGGGSASYTAGHGISISNQDVISVKTDGSTIHTNASGALEVLGGGGGGGGGDDAVYVNLGDIVDGIPVGQTEKWDEIAEYLVEEKTVIGIVSQGSISFETTAITQLNLAYMMSQLGVSTLAELKAACEDYDMLDMLIIKFVYEVDGSTLRIDVTPDAGIYPRYVFSDDFVAIQAVGLNMDVSLRPTNILRFKITNNKYVLDTSPYSYLDNDIEELLRDVVSTCSACKYTGWMGNTPGESTPAKFYGKNIPAKITLVDDPESGNTTIQIEVNGIVLKYDPNVPTYDLNTYVPAMWCGEFEFTKKHDYNRYWQTKDTAFELATVSE